MLEIDLQSFHPAESIRPLNKKAFVLEQLIIITCDLQSQFFSPCLHLVTRIHKYFPSRRAMSEHSIGHEMERENITA